MSTKIFETVQTTATRMVGPERPGGGDRTMIQIDDNRTGSFVQVYPSALQGILVALHDDGLPEHKADRDPVKYQLVSSCEVYGGRLEARYLLHGGELVFTLCVDRPDDADVGEVVLRSDQAEALIAMARLAEDLARGR